MKSVELSSEAEAELAEIVDWYAERSSSAAARFIDEVQAALDRVRERPRSFSPIAQTETARVVRRARCFRFPYALVYAELEDQIVVVAVAHLKRRPLYWVERLRQVE